MIDTPKFWRPEFLVELAPMVRELAQHYDGNPTVAELRISLGSMTEENPPVGWFGHTVAGYSDLGWIETCRKIVAIYRREFHSTRLEFDVSRMAIGHVVVKDPAYALAVDNLMSELQRSGVFLAYDGLASNAKNEKVVADKDAFMYPLVQRFAANPQRNGGGLELAGPLWYQKRHCRDIRDSEPHEAQPARDVRDRGRRNQLPAHGSESRQPERGRLARAGQGARCRDRQDERAVSTRWFRDFWGEMTAL